MKGIALYCICLRRDRHVLSQEENLTGFPHLLCPPSPFGYNHTAESAMFLKGT
jgi:hypothetical protein